MTHMSSIKYQVLKRVFLIKMMQVQGLTSSEANEYRGMTVFCLPYSCFSCRESDHLSGKLCPGEKNEPELPGELGYLL